MAHVENVTRGCFQNCGSFASGTFYEVTGIDIDADGILGIETPGELVEHIVEANGGTEKPGGNEAPEALNGSDDLSDLLGRVTSLLLGTAAFGSSLGTNATVGPLTPAGADELDLRDKSKPATQDDSGSKKETTGNTVLKSFQ